MEDFFNKDDYNDNIEYCRYVFEKNKDLDLSLTSARQIQSIANAYIDVLAAKGFDFEDEIVDNEDILQEVISRKQSELRRKFNRANPEKFTDIEKKAQMYGGYGLKEGFDDKPLEDNDIFQR